MREHVRSEPATEPEPSRAPAFQDLAGVIGNRAFSSVVARAHAPVLARWFGFGIKRMEGVVPGDEPKHGDPTIPESIRERL